MKKNTITLQIACCCLNHFFPWPLTLVQAQKSDPLKSRQQVDLERAHFLVTQAFEEDEKGNDDEAIELYTQAVELCIKTVSLSLCSFLCLSSCYILHLIVLTFIPLSVFTPVQWDVRAGAAEQTETAGTSSFRQVKMGTGTDFLLRARVLIIFNALELFVLVLFLFSFFVWKQKQRKPKLLHCVLQGRKVLKNPSPNQLQLRLRTGQGLLEPSPALEDLPASFSPLGRTSASMIDHNPSLSGLCSPVSPKVSATRLRRSRCSGEKAEQNFSPSSNWKVETELCVRSLQQEADEITALVVLRSF